MRHGGKFEGYETVHVTHVIVETLPHSKAARMTLKRKLGREVVLVREQFVWSSIDQGRRLPESQFTPHLHHQPMTGRLLKFLGEVCEEKKDLSTNYMPNDDVEKVVEEEEEEKVVEEGEEEEENSPSSLTQPIMGLVYPDSPQEQNPIKKKKKKKRFRDESWEGGNFTSPTKKIRKPPLLYSQVL